MTTTKERLAALGLTSFAEQIAQESVDINERYAARGLTTIREDVGVSSLPPAAIDWQFASDKSLVAAAGSNVAITRASVGNYFNASGNLVQAAINEPRWNHVMIGDSLVSAGLLAEPARTNGWLANTDLSNPNTTINNLVPTHGQPGIGGAGTTTATLFTDAVDGVSTFHRLYQSVNVTSGLTYCASAYIKPGTQKRLMIFNTGAALAFRVVFDFETLDVSTDKDYGAVGYIERCPNGWYRFWVVAVAGSTAAAAVQIWLPGDTSDEYQGAGARTFTLDHPQFEEGPGPSSPIVTNLATTRSADVPVLSGAGYTGVHNAAGITLVIETINQPGAASNVISVSDNSANNEIRLSFGATTSLIVASGGVNQATIDNGRSKLIHTVDRYAVAVGTNSAVLVSNGEASALDTSVTMPVSPDRLTLGAINGNIMRVRMIPSVVSTQNLEASTSPVAHSSKLLRIILDGNSLMSGVFCTEDKSPIAQARALLSSAYRHVSIEDYSVGGQRTTSMITDLATQIAPRIISDQTIVLVWEVSNDLIDSTAARTAVDRLWTYCDAIRHRRGKVIVLNVIDRADGVGAFDSLRVESNALIAAEWQDHADALVDVAGNAILNNPADTDYFVDGTHLTAAGNAIVADLLEPKIKSVARSLVFPDVTNLLLNTRFAGAVTGTPGTVPTSWLDSIIAGTTTLTSSGAALTVAMTTGRRVIYQTVALAAGTYDYEVDVVVNSGTQEFYSIFYTTAGSVT